MAVKVPPPGTHGGRFPKLPGWLARFFGRLQLGAFRRGRGGRTQGGVPALALETVGARSGEIRHAVIGYVGDGPGSWLVVASLAGAARNPGWLYNLARDPVATIEFGDRRRVRVRATTLEGPELDAAWRELATEAPEYPKYLSQTDRRIPVIRLREVESG